MVLRGFVPNLVTMSSPPVRPLMIAAALSACAAQPEVLNSERIKERFGSYGVAILSQDGDTRRSSLYSVTGDQRITRTYAVVRFVDVEALDLTGSHDKIIAGSSIGSTLQDDGWQVRKNSIHIGDMTVAGPDHPLAKRMHLRPPLQLAMHAYELYVDRGTRSLHYASIVETHHPDYLSSDELRNLYALEPDSTIDTAAIEALVALVSNDD